MHEFYETVTAEDAMCDIDKKVDGVVCHIVCTDPRAHEALATLCQEWRARMWIDWEQSKYSYDREKFMNERTLELSVGHTLVYASGNEKVTCRVIAVEEYRIAFSYKMPSGIWLDGQWLKKTNAIGNLLKLNAQFA